ncbi:MAG: hypothetical protein AMXMBFR76_23420 [Pseudomonadota bacterium]
MCPQSFRPQRFPWRLAILVTFLAMGGPLGAAPPEGKGPSAHPSGPADKHHGGPDGAPGHGKKAGAGESDGHDRARYVDIDRAQVRQLVVTHHVAGHAPLPPGIRRNLVRGKPLPPGIARQVVPASILAALPRYPGHEWIVCGTDLVLIAVAGAIVADILTDVFE